MKLLLYILLTGFALVFAYGPDSLNVKLESWESPTGVWWPQNAKNPQKAANASVLVWLHGGMSSRNCSKGLVAGTDLANLYPKAIVISPSACMENVWVTSQAIDAIDAALDSIARIRGKKIETISLVGVSDGSLGVLVYSLRGKRSVKSRLLVSSYGGLLGLPESWASQKKLQSGKWRFLQGGNDRLFPFQESVPWIQSFCKGVGTDCDLRFDQVGEHDWSFWKKVHLDWIREAILD